jgi:hypothetical protein
MERKVEMDNLLLKLQERADHWSIVPEGLDKKDALRLYREGRRDQALEDRRVFADAAGIKLIEEEEKDEGVYSCVAEKRNSFK